MEIIWNKNMEIIGYLKITMQENNKTIKLLNIVNSADGIEQCKCSLCSPTDASLKIEVN
jgi:hypothetical protein